WLIVGVAAIAPFVMWRIHRMSVPQRKKPAVERSQEQPQTLTEPPSERAHAAAPERPAERSPKAPSERPDRPQSERGR
ncbi:hypothetical protein KBZ21_44215, partial [Streptomyces sp. A73]|nr:hypothetical protein [Streptomyces sp. A73]